MSVVRSARLHRWIEEHDERWTFTLGYVSLAVILSLWLSLFWLLVMVGVHFGFEWARQSRRFRRSREVVLEALWETKLDIALVLFALALSLYLEAVLGLLGLRSAGQMAGAARATARVAPRITGWQKVIQGTFLVLDDFIHVFRMFGRSKKGKNATPAPSGRANLPGAGSDDSGSKDAETEAGAPPVAAVVSWASRWGRGDWLTVALALSSAALILAAPWGLAIGWADVVANLAAELRPLPGP